MTGKEFAERVDYLLKQRNQTRKAITNDLGISSSTMSSWAAGRGSIPNANVVAQIAEYLNTSTDWLISGKEKQVAGLSAEEQSIIDKYRTLKRENQITVIDFINSLALLNQQNQNAISAG